MASRPIVAIYCRQSVEKVDSISIEAQAEACRRSLTVAEAENQKLYVDRGFSGKDTNRPAFQELLSDINVGLIGKIVVYKVDRISRCLLDFVGMEEEFQRQGVAFMSVNERFDTSTDVGEMMLRLVVMFAEMERKQIQKRTRDNYYARGERGLYLGGYAPFGYDKAETRVDGKRTSMLEENVDEAMVLRDIYAKYLGGVSLNEIAKALNANGVETRKNSDWSGSCISRILKNPVYVRADAEVFNYLSSLGATINNPIDAFVGEKGLMSYGNLNDRKKTNSSKFTNFSTDNITLGLHKGIIDSAIWLAVQYKLSRNRKGENSNRGNGSLTWLQGLVKCGSCGYSLYVKQTVKSNNVYRYFYCRGKRQGTCKSSSKLIHVEAIEAEIEAIILDKLKALKNTAISEDGHNSAEENNLKIKISALEKRIEKLIDQLETDSELASKAIASRIDKLCKEKNALVQRLLNLQTESFGRSKKFSTAEILDRWEDMGINERKVVAKSLIHKIVVSDDGIEVEMK